MPALAMHFPVSAPRLLELLEERLHQDYGFLLSILPRSLFETRNGSIFIKQHHLPHDGFGGNPSYGSLLGESGALHLGATSPLEGKESSRITLKPNARDLDDRLVAFTRVPPLSWCFTLPPSPHRLGTSEWGKRTLALIQYYLLVWAFEEGYSGVVPGPHPDHLRDALDQLKRTRYYKQAVVRREDAEFFDVHISQLEDEKSHVVQCVSQADQVPHYHADRSLPATRFDDQHATLLSGENHIASVSTIDEILREMSYPISTEAGSDRATPTMDATEGRREDSQDALSKRSTSPKSLWHRTMLSNAPPSSDQLTQNQAADPDTSADSFETTTTPSTVPPRAVHKEELADEVTEQSGPAEMDDITGAARYALSEVTTGNKPVPQRIAGLDGSCSITSAASTPELAAIDQSTASPCGLQDPAVDEHLTQLRAKVGYDLLSLLPDLGTTTFRRLHPSHERPGYLSIRMLFGRAKQSAPVHLRGRNIWIVCKIHEKDARTAPRMLLDALSSDDNDLVEENLAFKATLPWLDLDAVFNIVTDQGLKREHQLKAIVKYYFILAANAKLHGFDQHLMPANDTFVEQMRTVCRRLQNSDSTPKPRKRRRMATENPTGISTPSNIDEESPDVPTLAGRRSGRSLKRSLSAHDTTTDHHGRISRPSTPKVALGPLVWTNAPSHVKNHFLDVKADPFDSDGDSGDEIPAGVPAHYHDILLKRVEARRMVQVHSFWVREHREKKNDHSKAARKLEWLVSHGKETHEATKDRIFTEKQLASRWQDRIEGRQAAMAGFRKKEKELDVVVQSIDRSVVRLWDAEQKQKDERETQNQQAMNGLQKPQ